MRHASVLATLPAGAPAAPAQADDQAIDQAVDQAGDDLALPDTRAARVAALAAMARLDAAIGGGHSATAVLEAWCGSHAAAGMPRLVAMRVAGADVPPTIEQRARLQVGPGEPVRHRRVRLACGTRVLSEAESWYVPSRLTPAMNHALETTDVPFGRVVAPFRPVRRRLASRVLWQARPADRGPRARHDDHPGRRLDVPRVLFEHRAILLDGEGRPLSEVDERYLRAILAFAPMR